MGKPIVYCSSCGAGLRESGSAKERVYRSGEMIYCERCRPADAQAESSISQRAVISNTRLPRLETPKAFPRPQPRPSGSTAPILAGAAAGLVLLVIVVVASSGRRPEPAPHAPVSKPAAKAPAAPNFAPELAKLDQEIRGALDREDFRGAVAALEGARSRRDDSHWTTPVDERIRDINARAMALFSSLKEEAKGDKAKLDSLRVRVERWGRRDFTTELARLIEMAEPPKPPPPPVVVERPWQPIFDGTSTSWLKGSSAKSWIAKDGALLRVEDNAAQAKQEFKDGELRIRFTTGTMENIFFCVRQGGEGRFALYWHRLRERVRPNQTHEVLFVMKGPDVTAAVDGRPIDLEVAGKPESGLLQFNGGDTFRLLSIDFRPLP